MYQAHVQKTQEIWIDKYADSLPSGFLDMLRLESRASSIHLFNAAVVPGLFQTEAYARAVVAQAGLLLSKDVQEERIQVRMDRQKYLFEKDTPPDIHLLLDQAALQR